jgi:hypothetical protein
MTSSAGRVYTTSSESADPESESSAACSSARGTLRIRGLRLNCSIDCERLRERLALSSRGLGPVCECRRARSLMLICCGRSKYSGTVMTVSPNQGLPSAERPTSNFKHRAIYSQIFRSDSTSTRTREADRT